MLPAYETISCVGDEAFRDGAFRYVVLSEKTGSIGENAFADCPQLRFLRIPNKTIFINEHAFGDCSDLAVFGYSDSKVETFANAHGFGFIPIE